MISAMVAGGSSSPFGSSVGDDAVLPFGAMVELLLAVGDLSTIFLARGVH